MVDVVNVENNDVVCTEVDVGVDVDVDSEFSQFFTIYRLR